MALSQREWVGAKPDSMRQQAIDKLRDTRLYKRRDTTYLHLPIARSRMLHLYQRAKLLQRRLCIGTITLTHSDDIGNFEEPCFDGLYFVTHPGCFNQEDSVCHICHRDIALPGSDGFEQDDIIPRSTECPDGIGSGACNPAIPTPISHAPNEDAAIARQIVHTDSVTQNRTATQW
jgi:hypothetical protein